MKEADLMKKFSQLEKELKNLRRHESLYEFEKEFVEKYEEFGRQLFEHILSKKEKDRHKKNDGNELWQGRDIEKFKLDRAVR